MTLSLFLDENSANVPWSGWDEEITKQTGGFTRDRNLRTGAKQKQKLQWEARREEESMDLFQIIKKNQTIKEIYWRKARRNAFFYSLTNQLMKKVWVCWGQISVRIIKKCTFWNIWTLGTFFGTRLIVPLPKSDCVVWSAAAAYGSVKVFVTFNWHHIASTELWKVVVNTFPPAGSTLVGREKPAFWFGPGRFSLSIWGDSRSRWCREFMCKKGEAKCWNGIEHQN